MDPCSQGSFIVLGILCWVQYVVEWTVTLILSRMERILVLL